MLSSANFASLELACLYCIKYATDTHYSNLREMIHLTLKRGLEAGIDIRFIQRNPIFIEAWNLFTGYKEPNGQHPNNVIYLSERLTPD
jgi:hypothetical protein